MWWPRPSTAKMSIEVTPDNWSPPTQKTKNKQTNKQTKQKKTNKPVRAPKIAFSVCDWAVFPNLFSTADPLSQDRHTAYPLQKNCHF
jgi:hypothetical protein